MKKITITLFCCLIYIIGHGQVLTTPIQTNYLCDDNIDGLVEFNLSEISLEISSGNPDLFITHHLSQNDALNNVNVLPNLYTNISNPQTIFVRAYNSVTTQLQFLVYGLHVIPPPPHPTVTITNCASLTNDFPCWNLPYATPNIIGTTSGQFLITYFTTQLDAQNNQNPIVNENCYISPIATPNQPPVYYRIESEDGCIASGTILLIIENCENPNCAAPSNLAISNIDLYDAAVSWTDSGQGLSWEYIVKLQNENPPTNNDNGEIIDSNPLYLLGLNCNTSYKVYLRTICDNNEISGWSSSSVFTTLSCTPGPNEPYQITECINNGQACFDLTQNDAIITANLNPADFVITYHLNQTDADSNSNALPTPYCVTTNTQSNYTLYSRIQNIVTNEVYVYPFIIYAQLITYDVIELNYIIACDEDQDATIPLNLTQITSQIITTNTLEYYSTLNNAFNQQSPILNPNAYPITSLIPIQRFYVRENIETTCDIIYFFDVLVYPNCDISFHCEYANPICTSLNVPIENIHDNSNAKLGNDYGCLGFYAKNPKWFTIPVTTNGTINLKIEQNSNINFTGSPINVGYIIYGPFNDSSTPCNTLFEYTDIVNCGASLGSVKFPTIANAQAGQYYIMMVSNISNQFGNESGYFKITELATSTGAIDCSGFRLNAFLDSNNNGTKESNESSFPLGQFTYEQNNNNEVHTIYDPSGVTKIYEDSTLNSYFLGYSINLNYTSYYSLPSTYSNVTIGNTLGMQNYNFPITSTQNYTDVEVRCVSVSAPRPGFTYQTKIVYNNLGSQTVATGTIQFVKDNLVTITNNSQTGTTPTSEGFSYTFTNLLPFETREMTITLQVPTIPTVSLGDLLTNSATIEPILNDIIVSNNTSSVSDIIIGSYDPNDKMESHGDKILFASFSQNDYLYYTIRFENTGTASAINVRINDILDSKLNKSTLEVISSSHAYRMDRLSNTVNWYFDAILLPVSVANTNIGKGYVTFKIKPMPGYTVGDIIPNTASIFFDFNQAIITNTFNTEFVATLSVNNFDNTNISIFPNPTQNILNIQSEETIKEVSVYDMLGKKIKVIQLSNTTLNVSNLAKGMYLIKMIGENDKTFSSKFIKE
jgi:uncharacterized repeat protein (TIGR01451 family)